VIREALGRSVACRCKRVHRRSFKHRRGPEVKIWNDPAGQVTFEPASRRRGFVALRHDVVGDVPFILPAGPEGTPVRVDVPFAYVQFLAIYVYLRIERHRAGAQPNWPELPAPQLEITYRDIGDNIHRRTFRVSPSFFYLSVPEVEDLNQVCGQAEFKIERR